MQNTIIKAYIFSRLQLDILLNRFGCTKIIGLESENEPVRVGKEEVYMELAKMVRDGILKNEGEEFVLEDQVRQILELMEKAEICIHIVRNETGSRDQMCYLNNDSVVVVSRSKVRKKKNTVTLLNRISFQNYILEGLLPHMSSEEKDLFREEDVDEIQEQTIMDMFREGLMPIELRWHAEIRNVKKNIREDIYILEMKEQRYCLSVGGGWKNRMLYRESEYAEWMMKKVTDMMDYS